MGTNFTHGSMGLIGQRSTVEYASRVRIYCEENGSSRTEDSNNCEDEYIDSSE